MPHALRAQFRDGLVLPEALRVHMVPGLLFDRPSDFDRRMDVIVGQIEGGRVVGEVPASLQAWIEAGPAPIYVGYGSMTVFNAGPKNPNNQLRIAAAAAKLAGMRAILHVGGSEWGSGKVEFPTGMREGANGDVFCVRGFVPHPALLPQCELVLAHGGTGTMTTVAALGIRHVLVGFDVPDQQYWFRRRQELGLSLPGQCLYAKDMTPATVAADLRRYACAPGLKERCAEFGRLLQGVLDIGGAAASGGVVDTTGDPSCTASLKTVLEIEAYVAERVAAAAAAPPAEGQGDTHQFETMKQMVQDAE